MQTDAEIEGRAAKWSDSTSIPVQPVLLKLAEIVREHTDKRRRAGPKWKFRLAPDLVMQIQPKLPGVSKRGGWSQRHESAFEGIAFQGDDVDVTTFANPRDTRFLGFVIDKNWVFRGNSIGPVPRQVITTWRPEYPRPLTAEQREEYMAEERQRWAASSATIAAIFGPLRARAIEAFERRFFEHLRTGQLLGGHCMCCGRALTDPTSRARFVGRNASAHLLPTSRGFSICSHGCWIRMSSRCSACVRPQLKTKCRWRSAGLPRPRTRTRAALLQILLRWSRRKIGHLRRSQPNRPGRRFAAGLTTERKDDDASSHYHR
jgi:hypothetical protein